MKQRLIRAACRIPLRRHLLLQRATGILLPQVGFRVENFLLKRLCGLFRRLSDPRRGRPSRVLADAPDFPALEMVVPEHRIMEREREMVH